MVLAHRSGIFDQQLVADAIRLREHGPGDLDRLIKSQQADHFQRRVARRRKTAAECGSGRNLQPLREAGHDIVEQLELDF
jgi:hypothetical protein